MRLAATCGMSENEFWDSTPRYLSAKIYAFEQGQRSEWERARYISMYAVKAADSKNRIKKATDLGKFPWEIKRPRKLTPEEIAAQKAFDIEADEILKRTNPAAYEAYQKAKNG